MKKNTIYFLFCLLTINTWAQEIYSAGTITYERKTNLEKKFGDNKMMAQWLNGETHKTDVFLMYFNDTSSLYMPKPSDVADRLSWATTKNIVYQVEPRDYRLSIYSFFMDQVFIEDSLYKREWKITGSTRNISGYECRKAIWQKNDSTRIYAWYTNELEPSIGPESFVGLPGTILGLATEDGGVVYFASKVETTPPDNIKSKVPEIKTSKLTTQTALKEKFAKELSQYPWAKKALDDLFTW
jgi:GLPGLI family protein